MSQVMSQVISGRLRRLAVTAAASFAAVTSLSAASTAAYAGVATEAGGAGRPVMPPPVRDEDRAPGPGHLTESDHLTESGHLTESDHLTVTVHQAGGDADGTYELYCHPGGGSHPDVEGACQVVERNTRWGEEIFAPVPENSICTLQYGGPATAHVTGTWAGWPVDAVFDRGDGCQIARWDRFVPLLPDLGP
ncbi:SSI family serine proteinase inhibitor [Streptomyces sp. NPDC059582]|uniref:SSI family serine proteinase inhibitor n=1 Tax=Streptomyces sp. NPDC059582 TaxID=3346875 RepID=UPI0036B96D58